MESMRAVGYTLETAIADIVDNSLAAGSKNVWVDFSSSGEPSIAISDDGHGMGVEAARLAMKLAAANPQRVRSPSDLGRFGLGLKTASLSQSRSVTLISKQSESWAGYRWDLDHLATTGAWELLGLDADECKAIPAARRLLSSDHGTVVVWDNLDLLSARIGPSQGALDAAMVQVQGHLSLVFHRFIAGDGPATTHIYLNDVALPAMDPFLSKHRATQKGPRETLPVAGEHIDVQPYTLPFISKLGKRDRELALGPGELRDSQGYYIYRGYRLVIWGTWFRLIARTELGKLARVKVDVPNTLDHLWSLDIKKSVASPPPEVRQQLKRLSEKIVAPSRRVQSFRGRSEKHSDGVVHLWNLVVDREAFRYEVNRDHPSVQACYRALEQDETGSLSMLLALLESTFPSHDVHLRLGKDQVDGWDSGKPQEVVAADLRIYWHLFRTQGRTIEEFIQAFQFVEPFNLIDDFASYCSRELQR